MKLHNDSTNKNISINWKCINVFCLAGVIVGIMGIIIGIVIYNSPLNFSFSSMRFGADFYTEIHEQVTAIANEVNRIKIAVSRGLGTLHILLGGLSVCYFGDKLITQYKSNATANNKYKEPELTDNDNIN